MIPNNQVSKDNYLRLLYHQALSVVSAAYSIMEPYIQQTTHNLETQDKAITNMSPNLLISITLQSAE